MGNEPVAVQVLPLWLPWTSVAMSSVAIIAMGILVWRGHGKGQLRPTANLILVGILIAGLLLQIGAPLNQLGILPLGPWTLISVFGRLVVMVGLITLITLDPE